MRDPHNTAVALLLEQARSAYAAGEMPQLRVLSERCLSLQPDHADALYLLGHSYVAEQRFGEAVQFFERSARAAPERIDAAADLGAALLACGRTRDGVAVLGPAAARAPGDRSLLNNLGQGYEQLGELDAACGAFRQALAADPGFASAHARLGCCLEKMGRLEEALAALESAVRCDARDGSHSYNLGVVLLRLRRFAPAAQAFEAAVRAGYATAATWNNLGFCQYRLGQMTAAAAHLHRALELDPHFAGAWDNLGGVAMEQGDVPGAIQHYERALQSEPSAWTVRLNLALAHLTAGDFTRGWPLFEARLLPGAAAVGLHVPQDVQPWDAGSSGPGQNVILVAEHGFGDAIQFARFGAVLAARGLRPILQCQPRLLRLLSSAPGFSEVVSDGTRYTPDRYQWFPLLSVPGVLGTRLDTIPAAIPYLQAEAERVSHWRGRLGPGRLRIGLAWQGDLVHEQEAVYGRALPLAKLEPLIATPDTEWISLQRGAGAERLPQMPWHAQVRSFGDELDAGTDAFLDSAALMMSLDLVITADTAIAHLAGALGREVWVALGFMPDWRWLLQRSDSPWYPTMRLFRQQQPGDWSGVIRAMQASLTALVAPPPPPA